MTATAADTTAGLFRRLRNRYGGSGGWVLLEGVGNGAGFGNDGWADAIAMQTWPSKVLELIGFEVKASRSDWLRELDKPNKNAEWQAACDSWFIVAPADIVKLEELPTTWGLMVPSGSDKLRIAKRCESPPASAPVSRDLLAAVFRAAGEVDKKRLSALRDEAYEQRQKRDDHNREIEDAAREKLAERVREAERKWAELSSALGNRWDDMGKLRAAARLVEEAATDALLERVEMAATSFEEFAANIREMKARLV